MRANPTAILVASLVAAGLAFAIPTVSASRTQDAPGAEAPPAANLPDWVLAARPGTSPIFLVRIPAGSCTPDQQVAGVRWLIDLETRHLAWGGGQAFGKDVVFMVEAPDHARLDELLQSSPWADGPAPSVEPLVRSAERLARAIKVSEEARLDRERREREAEERRLQRQQEMSSKSVPQPAPDRVATIPADR